MPFDPPLDFGIYLPSVVDRLKALAYFNDVRDIERATLALEGGLDALPPVAFVSNARESAERVKVMGGGAGGPESYRVTVDISTLFCIPAARWDREVADVVEKARRAVIRQLLQWTPEGGEVPLRYRGYQVRSVAEGLVWAEVVTWSSYRLTV